MKFVKPVLLAAMIAMSMQAPLSVAADPEINMEELQGFAAEQVNDMVKEALAEAEGRLNSIGSVKPFGVVILADGKVKVVRIAQDEGVPAEAGVAVVQRSFKALAQQGGIGASVVVYQSETEETKKNDTTLLTLEVEHVFGFAQAKLIPFKMKDGKAIFGEPIKGVMKPNVFERTVKKNDAAK